MQMLNVKCMIYDLFQVSNFDQVKEILQIRCYIYISMRNIDVKMKSIMKSQGEYKVIF